MTPPSPAKDLRVLVVDDDPGIRGLLTILFQREGWSVTALADGQAAAVHLERSNPDVIVLDLLMPGVSGFDLLETWPAAAPDKSSVIVLTAAASSQLRTLNDAPRVWKVLRKPFDNKDLLHTVRTCAGRCSSRQTFDEVESPGDRLRQAN
jgi:DNA-binding response OmpR family regulator